MSRLYGGNLKRNTLLLLEIFLGLSVVVITVVIPLILWGWAAYLVAVVSLFAGLICYFSYLDTKRDLERYD